MIKKKMKWISALSFDTFKNIDKMYKKIIQYNTKYSINATKCKTMLGKYFNKISNCILNIYYLFVIWRLIFCQSSVFKYDSVYKLSEF